jgi:hypothetical protein
MIVLFILAGLLIVFFVTKQFIEPFTSDTCNTYTACDTCADTDGCSWCPEKKLCFSNKRSIPSGCNVMSAISFKNGCSIDSTIPQLPPITDDTVVGALAGSNSSGGYDVTTDSLYKPLILDKTKPPNAYMIADMQYSPETVMANVNDVRQEVQRYQMELPNLITTYVNNMKS